MSVPKDVSALVSDFLLYLEVELERSQKTVENYSRYLSRYISSANIKKPGDITESSVERFLASCKRHPVCTRERTKKQVFIHEKTKNYYRTAVRMFLRFLETRGVVSLSPDRIELAPITLAQTTCLNQEEVKLLQSPSVKTDSMGIRDRAIVLTLLGTGVRVSELCSLNMEDIDLAGESCVVSMNGEKVRSAHLSSHAIHAIEEYLHVRQDQGNALFLNNGKRVNEVGETRLTPRSVQRIVQRYALSMGIFKGVTPHTLRHTFARQVLFEGADTTSAQALMGYESVSVMRAYARSILKTNIRKHN